MSWREAVETSDTSGFQLFQTAYIDANGNIESFSSGTNRVDKYISNDYLSLKYVLNVPYSYYYAFRSAVTNDWYKSKSGSSYDMVTKTAFVPSEYLGKIGNRIYVTGYDAPTWKIFYSDDEGTTWSSFASTGLTLARIIVANTGTDIFVAEYDGQLFKINGTTWTQITIPTSLVLTTVCWDGTRLIIGGIDGNTYVREIHYSTNGGSSWTQVGTDNLDESIYYISDVKYKDGVYYAIMCDTSTNFIYTCTDITNPTWSSVTGAFGYNSNPDGKILAIIAPDKILTSILETSGTYVYHSARLYYWNGTNNLQLSTYDDGAISVTFAEDLASLTKTAYNESQNKLLLSIGNISNGDAYLFLIDLNAINMTDLGSGTPTGKTVIRDNGTVYSDSYFVGA